MSFPGSHSQESPKDTKSTPNMGDDPSAFWYQEWLLGRRAEFWLGSPLWQEWGEKVGCCMDLIMIANDVH